MSALRKPARWPRLMREATAAEYVERELREFRHMVADGRMPASFPVDGQPCFDIEDLDEAVDALKTGAARASNWRDRNPTNAVPKSLAGR